LLLVPALLIVPRFLGLSGVFLSMPLADLAASLITAVLLVRELRDLREAEPNPIIVPDVQ